MTAMGWDEVNGRYVIVDNALQILTAMHDSHCEAVQ